jgi:hypothetical protein
MGSDATATPGRRERVVPDNAIYAALGAMAAVIEEPYCCVGRDELKGLVEAHARLSSVMGLERDYGMRNGAAIARRGGVVVKIPVPVDGLSNDQAAQLLTSGCSDEARA